MEKDKNGLIKALKEVGGVVREEGEKICVNFFKNRVISGTVFRRDCLLASDRTILPETYGYKISQIGPNIRLK